MKKIKLKSIVSLLLASSTVVSVCAMSSGCNINGVKPELGEPKLTRYSVEVENGTGGGEYRKGKEVTVTATVPEGEMFAKWVSDGEVVSTQNPYTFIPEGDIKLTAVVGTPYTITVEGGRIGDTLDTSAQIVENEEVTVTAKSTTTKTFLYWIENGDAENHITANPYTFSVTEDKTIQAVYDEIYLVSVADGTVYPKSEADKASRSMRFEGGAECTIKPNEAPEGQKFAYWYCLDEDNNEQILSEQSEYTFAVTQSRKIYAKYKFFYTVTVDGGYIGDKTSVTSAEVWAGDEITVTAVNPEGKGFVRWLSGGREVGNSYIYTFQVDANTDLKAEFGDLINLATPANDANQMFTKKPSGYSDMIVELDRQKTPEGERDTAFDEGVDYILYYLYTSPDADKADYVGQFKMEQTNGTGAEIMALDGSHAIGCGSTPGDYYFDRVSNDDFFGLIEAAVGEDYSAYETYYVAAQAIGIKNSVYADSGISEIGTSVIQRNAAYTVTVTNGEIIAGDIVGVGNKVAAGAVVTVKPAAGEGYYFDHWEIDGQVVSYDEEYTFTVNASTEIKAVLNEFSGETATITVEGGIIEGEESTTAELPVGKMVSIVAQIPDGKGFISWMSGETEVYDFYRYTFRVREDLNLVATFGDLHDPFETPANDANQMFVKKFPGYCDVLLEIDRQKNEDGSIKTAFVEGVEYIEFHLYTSTDANVNTDSVGSFMLIQENGAGYLVSPDNSVRLSLSGEPGNYYKDWMSNAEFFSLIRAAIGEAYNPSQAYYVAAQAVAKEGSVYRSSAISVIGTSVIQEQA